MMPPPMAGGGTNEINWPWIIRQLRGEPYHMSKGEILRLTMHETSTLMMKESSVSRNTDDEVDYADLRKASERRDELILDRMIRG